MTSLLLGLVEAALILALCARVFERVMRETSDPPAGPPPVRPRPLWAQIRAELIDLEFWRKKP